MPTLTTRIAAANKITTAAVTSSSSSSSSLLSTAATTMATHAANNSFDTTAGAAAMAAHTSNAAAAGATCTFSTNSDYLQHLQQQQQQQQHNSQQLQKQQHQLTAPPPPLPTQPQPQLNHHQHYYAHQLHNQQQQHHSNSPPPLPPPHPHLDVTRSAAGGTVAGSCSVTFNGNAAASNAANQIVSNGNISNFAGIVTHSNGNGNIMSPTFATTSTTSHPTAAAATTTAITTNAFNATVAAAAATAANLMQTNNKLETSSIAGSNSLNGSIKKSSSSSHASREDVASLGGGSSINSQSTAMHNNSNSNSNHTNNNHINSNNFTKDNPLQNYYNGLGVGGSSRNPDNDEDDGLGPLPPKWETAYTERGELYFIDHNTGTSHWLDPRLSKFQKKSLEDCSDNELPYGWEKIEDSLYGTYYIDHVNRRTQYENPVLEAKRRAAEQRKQQKLPPPPQHETGGEGGGGSQAGSSVCTDSITMNDIDQQRGPPPPPVVVGAEKPPPPLPMPLLPYKFTRNPAEMQGERITTTLLKSARGLGITIVGGDDSVEEFLQIKSIVPNGPAWLDGQLQMGDILVYVNDTCVLGFSHHEMVNVFQSILPGETVTLEVCRGYPLPFDPNDPNTEVVTTIAVDGITTEPEKQRRLLLDLNMDGNYNFLDVSDGAGNTLHDATLKNTPHAAESPGDFMLMKKPEVLTFSIFKGVMGFGFTIADSAYGQKVKKILDRNCCKQLQEGDILLEINAVSVRNKTHIEVVQVLKDCSKTTPTTVKIQRSGANFNASAHTVGNGSLGNVTKLRKNFIGNASGLFRSKTPTADLYSTQQKEILPIRPKTPLVDTRARARAQTPNNELNDAEVAAATNGIDAGAGVGLEKGRSLTTIAADSKSPQLDAKSTNSLQELDVIQQEIPFMDPYPKLVTSLSERLAEATLMSDGMNGASRAHGGGGAGYHVNAAVHANSNNNNSNNYENQEYVPSSSNHLGSGVGGGGGGYNPIYGMSSMLPANMNSLNPVHHIANGAQTNSGALYSPAMHLMPTTTTTPAPTYHHESCYCYECQDYQRYKYRQQQQQQQHQLPSLQTNYYTLQQQQSLNHHHQQQQQQQSQYSPAMQTTMAPTPLQAAHIQNERMQKRVNELLNDRRKVGFSPLETHHSSGNTSGYLHPQQQLQHQQQQQQQHSPAAMSMPQQQSQNNWNYNMLQPILGGGGGAHINGGSMTPGMRQCLDEDEHQFELTEVTLERQALGFGFRIVGGTEEGSQVTVGHIVPGGAADNDHRIATGDEILSIDGINVVNSSHHKVVSLMGEAALRGQVNMILRRRTLRHLMPMPTTLRLPVIRYPYDVIVSRHENEGFGFVIISSSNQYYGSTIGKLIPGSPADRCGELKVGDRIIAVNRLEIAGMSHGDVVQLIKESGLHVRLTIGCPKEGNPMLSTSAQASPGSQLSQTQQSSLSSTASAAVSSSLLQPSNATQQQSHQQQQQPKSETPTYFERNAQMSQHPQL